MGLYIVAATEKVSQCVYVCVCDLTSLPQNDTDNCLNDTCNFVTSAPNTIHITKVSVTIKMVALNSTNTVKL